MNPAVSIHDDLRHTLTPQSLLSEYGQLTVTIKDDLLSSDTLFFAIQGFGFSFSFCLRNGELIIERNCYSLVVPISDIPELTQRNILFMAWSPTRLFIASAPTTNVKADIFSTACEIPNISAPADLCAFAREKSLEARRLFGTKREFTSRVYEALSLLQDKIDDMHSPGLFWDKTYSNNKVMSRTPKREMDINPAMTLAVSDHMLLSGIQMSSEYATSRGRLDCLFTGAVLNEGLVHVCAEFKNYHSPDLLDGLERQLPAYMESNRVTDGAYCILDFRGEWFDQPQTTEEEFLVLMQRPCLRLKAEKGLRIKVLKFRLGKRKSASRSG